MRNLEDWNWSLEEDLIEGLKIEIGTEDWETGIEGFEDWIGTEDRSFEALEIGIGDSEDWTEE